MEEGASSEEERAADALHIEPDCIDTGIATFVLISGAVFLVISSVAMALFFRERNAFEIRARSAYLSLLNGLCYMAVLTAIVVRQLPATLLQVEVNIYAIFTAYIFLSVCSTCCYGSRTIRLLVLYSPTARKVAPWLVSERNHVIACLLLGAASTAVPLYDMGQVSDGPLREMEYYVLVTKHHWIVLFSSQATLLLLNPIAWFIDDLFGIGPELRAIMVVQLVTLLTGKLAEVFASPDLLRWISTQKMGFLGSTIMISISIIAPIRRRLLHPLQSSDPKVLKALARRRALGARKGTSGGPFVSGGTLTTHDDNGFYFSWRMPSCTQPPSAGSSPGSWTYERVVSIPEVSAAFEAFSRKALCQESFLFLRDVTKFQAQGFGEDGAELAGDSETADGGGGGGTSSDEKPKGQHSGNGGEARSQEQQFKLFTNVVHEYIVDGAPNEINLSCKDKSDILDVYNNKHLGGLGFNELPASDRMLVFARAFAEIRFLLESNLMLKFVSTDEFAAALAASRRTQESC